MTDMVIGDARCCTHRQDLTAQRQEFARLGVAPERICMDMGVTGTIRARPGRDQDVAAVRRGDTLVGLRVGPNDATPGGNSSPGNAAKRRICVGNQKGTAMDRSVISWKFTGPQRQNLVQLCNVSRWPVQ